VVDPSASGTGGPNSNPLLSIASFPLLRILGFNRTIAGLGPWLRFLGSASSKPVVVSTYASPAYRPSPRRLRFNHRGTGCLRSSPMFFGKFGFPSELFLRSRDTDLLPTSPGLRVTQRRPRKPPMVCPWIRDRCQFRRPFLPDLLLFPSPEFRMLFPRRALMMFLPRAPADSRLDSGVRWRRSSTCSSIFPRGSTVYLSRTPLFTVR